MTTEELEALKEKIKSGVDMGTKCPFGPHCPECHSHRRNTPGPVTPSGRDWCLNDWHTHTFDGHAYTDKRDAVDASNENSLPIT